MIVALFALALAAPPMPMPMHEQLAQAEIVAVAMPVRVEFQDLADGETLHVRDSFWVAYRVVEAVRGAEVGDVLRVRQNTYCAPSGQTVRRAGDAFFHLDHEGKPVREALDPAQWIDGGRSHWLLLRPTDDGIHHPVQFTYAVDNRDGEAVREALAEVAK